MIKQTDTSRLYLSIGDKILREGSARDENQPLQQPGGCRLGREAEDNCHNYWTMGGIRKDFLLLGRNEGNERKMW